MPIGTTAAIIGGSLIAGGATVAAANSNKKAIGQTTDASLQANRESIAAQERMNAQNLALQQSALDQTLGYQQGAFNSSGQLQTDIYNRNSAAYNPYLATGVAANSQINALLGLDTSGYQPAAPIQFQPVGNPASDPAPAVTNPGTPATAQYTPPIDPYQGNSGSVFDNTAPAIAQARLAEYYGQVPPIPAYAYGTPPQGHPGGMALYGERVPEILQFPGGGQQLATGPTFGNLPAGTEVTPIDRPNALLGRDRGDRPMRRTGPGGRGGGNPNNGAGAGGSNGTEPNGTGAAAVSPQQTALDNFYNTQFYQFPLEQGLQAINANYAARGLLESGAAQKSLLNYASGVASGAFGDYLGALGNQQGLGFSAASAQGGVGQGYANSLTGLNNNYAQALTNATGNFANNAAAGNTNLANAYSQGAYNVGNTLSNAAIARANNTNSLIGGLGSTFGSALGGLAYRPYAGMSYYPLTPGGGIGGGLGAPGTALSNAALGL